MPGRHVRTTRRARLRTRPRRADGGDPRGTGHCGPDRRARRSRKEARQAARRGGSRRARDAAPIREVSSLFVSRYGDAVRYFVLLEDDPYSAHAVSLLKGLSARLPTLVDRAGLGGAKTLIAGDTAAARDAVGATPRSLPHRPGRRARQPDPARALPPRPHRTALSRAGERPRAAGRRRAVDALLPRRARLSGPDVLRAARVGDAPRVAGGGLQPRCAPRRVPSAG